MRLSLDLCPPKDSTIDCRAQVELIDISTVKLDHHEVIQSLIRDSSSLITTDELQLAKASLNFRA